METSSFPVKECKMLFFSYFVIIHDHMSLKPDQMYFYFIRIQNAQYRAIPALTWASWIAPFSHFVQHAGPA